MKIILSVILLIESLLSIQVWADVPNYDTSTRIISFPKVIFDSKDTYIDTQLRLNQDGSWDLLAIEAEPQLNLTGDWSGEIQEAGDFSATLIHVAYIKMSLVQNRNKLTGTVEFFRSCYGSFEQCQKMGEIIGIVNGRDISFSIILDDFSEIQYRGTVSDNYRTLDVIGPRAIEGIDKQVPWAIVRQD